MRVLVAFGEEHRAYREVVAAGIRIMRPRADVATSTPTELEGEIGRFDPHVVVCVAPSPVADTAVRPAWVTLDLRPGRAAKVRVGSRRRELPSPTLEDLLRVVDEAEELVGKDEARASDRRSGNDRPTGG
jgi:hypothetical protein